MMTRPLFPQPLKGFQVIFSLLRERERDGDSNARLWTFEREAGAERSAAGKAANRNEQDWTEQKIIAAVEGDPGGCFSQISASKISDNFSLPTKPREGGGGIRSGCCRVVHIVFLIAKNFDWRNPALFGHSLGSILIAIETTFVVVPKASSQKKKKKGLVCVCVRRCRCLFVCLISKPKFVI